MAARWAESIADDRTRQQQMEQAARQWLETDRAAAEPWIQASNLSDEQKQNLLRRAP